MNNILQIASNKFDSYFNAKVVRKIELLLLRAAVFSFILHLAIIYLGNNFIELNIFIILKIYPFYFVVFTTRLWNIR
jgi:hypothetical protein